MYNPTESVVQILKCNQILTDIYERALNENWFSLYSNLWYYQTKYALNIFLMLEYFSENLLSLTWIFCIKNVTRYQLINPFNHQIKWYVLCKVSISHQLSVKKYMQKCMKIFSRKAFQVRKWFEKFKFWWLSVFPPITCWSKTNKTNRNGQNFLLFIIQMIINSILISTTIIPFS